MAKKRRKQLKTVLGGLKPIKKSNIAWLEKVTRKVIIYKTILNWRVKPNQQIDSIEVYGIIETKHEDGTEMSSIRKEQPLFIIVDTKATAEYDVFEESLWLQEDIDNPAYIVEGDPVTRIYYVDGQEDDGDGNMIDKEVNIEPYQKKGRIDESTEVIIIPADEPLAEIYTNIGPYLEGLVKNKLNQMY